MWTWLKEFSGFCKKEKKWWLAPLIISLLILAALVFFTRSQAPLSPYMYQGR
jgi:hypothetical protein